MKRTTQGSRFFMHILRACRNEFGAQEMCFSLFNSAVSVCSPSQGGFSYTASTYTNSKSVAAAGFLVQANLIAGCVFARRQTRAALCEWHFVISRMHI